MLLGCIGDDFTGSSDLANTLVKEGMRTTQYCGVPDGPAEPDVEAGIVALKSRTIPAAEAVALSLKALDWLLAQGCRQVLFKYCSTFDSTPDGNIGPVIEALMARLETPTAIVCPAFPATGRSVYQGHLFVKDKLLSQSGMENHPLTPMTDPDLRRWLKRQTKGAVGHVAAATVFDGPEAIRAALHAETAAGRGIVVVDAIRDLDLRAIGAAAKDMKLITGGSGIALGLPDNFRSDGLIEAGIAEFAGSSGPAVIVSGSCSNMTRAQVATYRDGHPVFDVEPDALMSGETTAATALEWALDRTAGGAVPLVSSSAEPAVVRAAQERHGRDAVAGAIEAFFAELARGLVAGGITRLVVAGGETSGAVVEGLGLTALSIGPEIAPGVPAVKASDRPLWLTLKSGNFGDEGFFESAVAALGKNPHDA